MLTHKTDLKLSLSGAIIVIDEYVTQASTDPAVAAVTAHRQQLCDTKDAMIRDALIALGWTPPPALMHSRRGDPTDA